MIQPGRRRAFRALSLLLAMVILLALGCPALAQSSREKELEERLTNQGVAAVSEVAISPDQVTVTYTVPVAQDEESLFSTWLLIMQAAVEVTPDVERVVIRADHQQEPFAEISAPAADVKAVLAGELDLLAFFENITLVERRPPQTAIRQELSLLGVHTNEVTIGANEVTVGFRQPPAESSQEMMTVWYRVMDLVAEKAPGKERIVLHPLLADGTLVTVEASRADVLAYRSGALSAPEFLSTLQVTDAAATMATPEGVREAGAQSPAAAPGGAADRKAGLPLGLWLGIIVLISAAAGVGVWQLGKRRWAATAAVVPTGGQRCPQCGAELAPGGAFCSVCGAPRRQLPPRFAEAGRRLAALRARYQAGEPDDAAYRAELQSLVIQDQPGGYWTPGGDAGEWYWHDGRQWVLRDPPLVQPPRT